MTPTLPNADELEVRAWIVPFEGSGVLTAQESIAQQYLEAGRDIEPLVTLSSTKALQSRAEAAEAEVKRLREALELPFAMLFLDGRNEHGTHVIPCSLRSMPEEFLVGEDIGEMAEEIMQAAEVAGFCVGDCVFAEFSWVPDQIGDEGRIEVRGYWDFRQIHADLSERSALSGGTSNG